MMMMDLVDIKSILELWIGKYLLTDAMTGIAGCLLVFFNFWIAPGTAVMLPDFYQAS